MKLASLRAGALGLGLVVAAAAQAQLYTTVDMSAVKNYDFASLTRGSDYATVFGTPWTDADGISFDVGSAPLRLWLSDDNYVTPPPGEANLTITLAVSVAKPTAVYTLMNTAFGVAAADTARIDLHGSGGALQSVTFVAGVDIRDHFQNVYPNTINGTTTVSVYDSGFGTRLDRQRIDLDGSFAAQTLTRIVITDLIDGGSSELLLAGVTVAAVPEPGTYAPMALGVLALGAAVRRRRP